MCAGMKGVCVSKTLCYYSLSKSAQWGEGPGVSLSQREGSQEINGRGNPFRNMNGLRRKTDDSATNEGENKTIR